MGAWSLLSNRVSWAECQKCTINNCRTTLRILFAIFWMIVAFSGSIVFGVFENIHAVVWSGLSAVFASFIFSLHIFILRDVERQKLTSWHFYVITIVGAIGFVAGLLGFIVYVILGKQYKEQGTINLKLPKEKLKLETNCDIRPTFKL